MTAVPKLKDLDRADSADEGDPIIQTWKNREKIKNGWVGLIATLVIAAFGAGAWWFGVATKPWVRDHVKSKLSEEVEIRRGEAVKTETMRIDIGVIKSKVQSLERHDERIQDQFQRIYEELGAIPEIRRTRRARERERLEAAQDSEETRPPRRPR